MEGIAEGGGVYNCLKWAINSAVLETGDVEREYSEEHGMEWRIGGGALSDGKWIC